MRTEKVDHKQEKWLYLAAGIGMLALLYAIFLPVFNTNDDQAMMHLVDGAYGFTDPHMVFQHVFIGYLYQMLYRINGALPWYTGFQMTVTALSLAVIGWCIGKRFSRMNTWVIYGLILVIVGYEGYVQIQFTKTAGIAAAAGMCLLLLFYTGEEDRKALALGLVLLSGGSMIRYKEALVVIALSGPAWIGAMDLRKGRIGRSLRRALLIAGAALLLVLGLRMVDRMSYRSDEWKSYMQFNKLRGSLLDGGLPNFEEHKEEYQALGLDVYAFNMFRGWAFADPEVFTTEALQGMRDMQETDRTYLDREKMSYFLTVEPKKILRSIPAAYLFIAAIAIALLLGHCRGRELACLLLMAGEFGLIYFDLYRKGKDLSPRVDTPIFLAMSLSALFLCTGSRHRDERESGHVQRAVRAEKVKSVVSLLIAAVILGWMLHHTTDATRPVLRRSEEAQEIIAARARNKSVLEATAADTAHTYISRFDTISPDRAFGPFDTAPRGILSNIVYTGGWSTWSPVYRHLMESHGITNPLRDFVDNDRLYLADEARDLLKGYLAVHMGCSVAFEEVPSAETGIERIRICRVHTE